MTHRAFALFLGLVLACSANAQGVDEAMQKVIEQLLQVRP